ncbi:DUF4115 domain-containing protein [Roseospira marina]|uniref:DUF4115 domain-containing protein n=1 Tax=Roseospira marina TaxID=140057 RepID=A0A5M6IEC6_9PROT|nr:RodZ domain-containing protein [Roseospira marina]KAA5606452.1 DUF4115 domain-containing protein [Roseospira marina]MBB4314133.1 cytoskeletal protein RodZ [Roseospira marina]MBB5087294.1 cytoskeletal protein RodZ [Roseospira marina]
MANSAERLNPNSEFIPTDHVGVLLQEARLRSGQDLRIVADDLRIKYHHLLAIEAGHFEDLPGSTYVVGFIRAYAEYLGLDAEEIVRRHKDGPAPRSAAPHLDFPSPANDSGVPAGALLLVALILAGCAYGVWYWMSSSNTSIAELIPEIPAQLAELIGSDDDTTSGPEAPAPETAPDATPGTDPAGQTIPGESTRGADGTQQAPGTPQGQTTTPPAADAPTGGLAALSPTTPDAAEDATEDGDDATIDPVPDAVPDAVQDGEGAVGEGPVGDGRGGEVPGRAVTDNGRPVPPAPPEPAVSDAGPDASADPMTDTAEEPAPSGGAESPSDSADAPVEAADAVAPETPAETPAEPAEATADAVPTLPEPETPDTATTEPPEVPTPEATEAAEEPAAEDPPPAYVGRAAPSDVAQAAGASRIVLRANQDSWIQLRQGGELVVRRLLRRGDVYAVPGDGTYALNTSNAGGLEVYVDGRRVRNIGPVGAPRNGVRLSPSALN